MSKVEVKIDAKSIDKTIRELTKWDLNLRAKIDKEAKKVANEVKADAKGRISKVTGNLEKSIGVKKISDMEYTVFPRTAKGKKGFHRHLVEYGTIHMRPRPYMRPAEDGKSGEYGPRMKKVLDNYDQTI